MQYLLRKKKLQKIFVKFYKIMLDILLYICYNFSVLISMKEVTIVTFVQTGTKDDEYLAMCAQAGDRKAAEVLIREYIGFVCNCAKSYYLKGFDRDDAIQEGLIGLYNAIINYSPNKNTSFRSFAGLCISRHIIDAVRMCSRLKHAPLNSYVSLNKETNDKCETTQFQYFACSHCSDPEAIVINQESLNGIECKIKNTLSFFERRVLTHYLDGLTYRQIGDLVERDSKSVDNAVQRIRKKLMCVLNRS